MFNPYKTFVARKFVSPIHKGLMWLMKVHKNFSAMNKHRIKIFIGWRSQQSWAILLKKVMKGRVMFFLSLFKGKGLNLLIRLMRMKRPHHYFLLWLGLKIMITKNMKGLLKTSNVRQLWLKKPQNSFSFKKTKSHSQNGL